MELMYVGLLLLVGVQRLWECGQSSRHQRRLVAKGATPLYEPRFRWIVAVHILLLAGSALEVILLDRPLYPLLAIAMLAVFGGAMALRTWVIGTLRHRWTVTVMTWHDLTICQEGPYRWIRHPNYLAVILEFLALPLIHSAWLTALAASLLNGVLLYHRIREEEQFLLSLPAYQAAMGPKPRLIPFRLPTAG